MSNSFETSFISQAVEKTPFVDEPSQKFFAEWCEINDSIVPEFVPREEWQERGVLGILEKNDKGKQTLFLPKDLHLWEMMDIIKAVDYDTLARNPEKREERVNQIQELGATFEKAGLYLSEYLPTLDKEDERSIAKEISLKFYQYGLSLQNKEQRTNNIPEGLSISKEDKIKLDEWFLGRDAYRRRLVRLGENPSEEQIEDTRKKLLQGYFKALTKEGYKEEGENPWKTETGPAQYLQDRTKRQIIKVIGTPERELETAIFRRGVERLVTGMNTPNWRESVRTFLRKGYGLDLAVEKVKLINSLELPKLKRELDEIKQTQNVAKISAKELEIAKKIQKAVRSFPYKAQKENDGGSNYPSQILKTQFVNCVGSSILGGGLLDEVGIKYLHASLPGHSATVLITTDGKVYWQDFTPPGRNDAHYVEITSDMLEGNIDLSNLAHIQDSSFTIEFKYWYLNNNKLRVTLSRPEIGLQCHILNNTGGLLSSLGRNEEAIEAYRQAININPREAYPYQGLGYVLSNLGRNEEAIEAYRQAISIDPKFTNPYNGLGNALSDLGRNEEALDAYKQAININPKEAYSYDGLGNALGALGRKEEAIKAYKQAISIDPKYTNPYNGLGNVLSDLGRKEEAIKTYKQAISIDPQFTPPYNGLGNALSDLGRNEEAIEVYRKAININPEDAPPYNGLGNVLSDLGRNEEAIEAYQAFIKLWKGDEHWRKRAERKIEELRQKQGY